MRPGPARPSASLGRRLLTGGTVLVVLALAVTGLAIGVALHRFVAGQVDGRLDGQIAAVADALRPTPEGGWRLERIVDGPPFDRPGTGWGWMVLAPGPVLRSRSLGEETIRVAVTGPEDHPPPPRDGEPDAPRDGPGPPFGPPVSRPVTREGAGPRGEPLRVRVRRFASGVVPVTIEAAAPARAVLDPLRDAMWPMSVVLAGLAALLIGGGVAQVRLGLRPLRILGDELSALREGRAARIVGPQPAEIQPLVAELNALLEQHDSNLERARRHVANLAHGLKTPLATLDLAIAGKAAPDPAALRPLVGAMDRMIRHHLARARAAALAGPSRTRAILGDRIGDLRTVFMRLYAEKAVDLAVSVPDDLAAACEPQDFDEILGNVIDNACRWATRRVEVTAAESGGRVAIRIGDDGPGLAEAAIAQALRPGLRLDEQVAGYGFGLPIARELAELYGGGIELGPAGLGGLQVMVTLPRAGGSGAR